MRSSTIYQVYKKGKLINEFSYSDAIDFLGVTKSIFDYRFKYGKKDALINGYTIIKGEGKVRVTRQTNRKGGFDMTEEEWKSEWTKECKKWQKYFQSCLD